MNIVHKKEETDGQREERQAIEFENKLARIRGAQVMAGEAAVIESLRSKGLIV